MYNSLIHNVEYVDNLKGHLLEFTASDSQWSCFKGIRELKILLIPEVGSACLKDNHLDQTPDLLLVKFCEILRHFQFFIMLALNNLINLASWQVIEE